MIMFLRRGFNDSFLTAVLPRLGTAQEQRYRFSFDGRAPRVDCALTLVADVLWCLETGWSCILEIQITLPKLQRSIPQTGWGSSMLSSKLQRLSANIANICNLELHQEMHTFATSSMQAKLLAPQDSEAALLKLLV